MSDPSVSVRPSSRSGEVGIAQGVKIPFRVVRCSSFEDGFEPQQLELAVQNTSNGASSNTHIKGWQSARFCTYPQSLILYFPQKYDVRKIQILSHQSKIAQTVEIYSGEGAEEANENPELIDFTRLGYLSLDANERSNYKARELKSVYVHTRNSNFLKFVFKKCYENQLNIYQQVGIIAINVVGQKPSSSSTSSASGHQASSNSSAQTHGGPSVIAVPSVDIPAWLDDKTKAQLTELTNLKYKAIQREDYDEAKRLKIIIDMLKQNAEKIALLEKEKMAAIAAEDFDLAKRIKMELDYLRNASQPQPPPPHHHHPMHPHHHEYDTLPPQHYPPPHHHPHHPPPQQYNDYPPPHMQQPYNDYPPQQPPSMGVERQMPRQPSEGNFNAPPPAGPIYDEDRPLRGVADAQVVPGPQYSAANAAMLPPGDRAIRKNPSLANLSMEDNRPIRPSRKSGAGVGNNNGAPEDEYGADPDSFAADAQMNNNSNADDTQAPAAEPLSAVNRKDAEGLIELFGEPLVQNLYSRHWLNRQSGIKEIISLLSTDQLANQPPKNILLQVVKVLRKTLSDKVSQVFLASASLLGLLCDKFLPPLALQGQTQVIRELFDPLIALMADKLSSSNVRERDGGLQILLYLALDPSIPAAAVPNVLLAPLKKKEKDSPLPLKWRAILLLKCVLHFGLEDSAGLSVNHLVKFITPHLAHRDGAVRESMFNLAAGIAQIISPPKLLSFFKEVRQSTLDSLQARLDDVIEGRITFHNPKQPSLATPYLSDNDPPVTAGAGGNPSSLPVGNNMKAGANARSPQQQQRQMANGNTKNNKDNSKRNSNEMPPAQPLQNQTPLLDNSQAPLEEESLDLQGKCQFCGLEDPSFTEEKLDLHYWQDCPMLISCRHCEQVIEIPTLNAHVLSECEVALNQGLFVACNICNEPVLRDKLAEHQADMSVCSLPPVGTIKCSLCQAILEASDAGWRDHLLAQGCPKNTRAVKH